MQRFADDQGLGRSKVLLSPRMIAHSLSGTIAAVTGSLAGAARRDREDEASLGGTQRHWRLVETHGEEWYGCMLSVDYA